MNKEEKVAEVEDQQTEQSASDTGETGETAPRVQFTPEQQAAIDELVAERVRRAERVAAQKAKAEADEAMRRASMDETERLKAEKEEAEKRAAEAITHAERTLVAAEARMRAVAAGAKPERVDKIMRLLNLDEVPVEDGQPDTKAVADAVAALKGDIPELFTQTPPARSGAEMDQSEKRIWTRGQIAELAKHPEEYAKHEAEIDAAMSEGRIKP